jgi:peptidoglycan/LPS O-acetylase OafA/YrhL
MSLGSWRFFLAFLVVISHLWADMIHGPAAYAVWGFFLISGYLMTHVVKQKYGWDRKGLQDYASNRFLRIYPTYFLACLLGFIALQLLPSMGVQPSALNPEFVLPVTWRDGLSNLTLLPFWSSGHLLVPVSGALRVEVGAYLLIPLLAAAPAAAWIGIILSAIVNLQLGLTPDQFGLRYTGFLTCFMAFGVGSLVCHYKPWLEKLASPLGSTLAWLAHCTVWLFWDIWPWTFGLYVSLILTAWVLISFVDRKPSGFDKWLGDLSYPVYLFHTTVGVALFGLFEQQRSFTFFAASFVATMLLCSAVVILIDKPLQRIKRRQA